MSALLYWLEMLSVSMVFNKLINIFICKMLSVYN